MPAPLLLYGATGYTGRLIVAEALRRGLRPILAGRRAEALAALAAEAGLSYRVAILENPESLERALDGVGAVLHAAGPFVDTAQPMLNACLRTGSHYLDITGELMVMEALAARGADARRRGIMVMPGVGFDVVPSDCLAAHVAARLPSATRLVLAIRGLALSTRGSARTLIRYAGLDRTVRRGGQLVRVPAGSLERQFDFGDGPERCLNVGWGDVATAWFTTGIPDIEVYFDALPMREAMLASSRTAGGILQLPVWQAWLNAAAGWLPEGPTAAQREDGEMRLLAEVTDAAGRCARARLRTPEAYACTATTAVAVAERVVAGDVELGFQTPARVYGADFILACDGVERVDIA
jgi:short subunit dehydrogenase-like uncharacterized protein